MRDKIVAMTTGKDGRIYGLSQQGSLYQLITSEEDYWSEEDGEWRSGPAWEHVCYSPPLPALPPPENKNPG